MVTYKSGFSRVFSFLKSAQAPLSSKFVEIQSQSLKKLRKRLISFINDILRGNIDIPKYFMSGKLILLNKKPGVSHCRPQDTRPIVVLPAIRKLVELALLERVSNTLWKTIGLYQMGFRPGASTHIQILRCISKMNSGVYKAALFIDLKKAYDMVDRGILFDAIRERLSGEY